MRILIHYIGGDIKEVKTSHVHIDTASVGVTVKHPEAGEVDYFLTNLPGGDSFDTKGRRVSYIEIVKG